ncbi:MAG TPA: ATPase, partial [Bacteroidales bacterium]|nr:ATPase [Bacteroidales bacterium]
MMLIADSGSTKTTWVLVNDNRAEKVINTSGINPMYQDEEGIFNVLKKEFSPSVTGTVSVYFYGAGCINNDVNKTVRNALDRFFRCREISVSTDLMAAARSLCRKQEGIACILGTGSNSCYYDGSEIVRNVSPLGYMLGDEGSGAVIGRKLIADLLKNQLSSSIRENFFSTYNLSPYQIMDHVYKKPFPNRFLAQFTRFIYDHRDIPELISIVKTSFVDFFERNVRQYPEASRLPVHFTGS